MKYVSYLVVAAVVIGGGWWYFSQDKTGNELTASPENGLEETIDGDELATSTGAMSTSTGATATSSMMKKPDIKKFEVSASNFKFSVKEIKVKKGDRVRIILTSAEGFHDWVVDEFDAKTVQLNTGETDMVEFTADKTGTFEYYCSVGSHRAMGMVGKLIVE